MSELANCRSDIADLASKLEQVMSPVYGKYRGRVTDNEDPEGRGRIKLTVQSLLGNAETNWALPCQPFGGLAAVGAFLVPPVGATVWVEFEQGDISHPIWTGAYWNAESEPPATDPAFHVWQTPFGHRVELSDAEGEERITITHAGEGAPNIQIDEAGSIITTDGAGAKVTLDANAGEISITDANGNSVVLSATGIAAEDSNGQSVKLEASGATIKANKITLDAPIVELGGAGGEPVLKGQSFLTFFMTHTHPTGVGPSGPPIPQGEATALSAAVLTK